MKKTKTENLTRFTMLQASREFGVPRTTLRRILQSAGLSVAEGATYTCSEVHKSLTGSDGIDWRARLLRARALRQEQDLAQERGRLVDAHVLGAQLQLAAGACRGLIFRVIQEAPPRFAALGDDMPGIRMLLRDLLWTHFERFRECVSPFLKATDQTTVAAQEKITHPES